MTIDHTPSSYTVIGVMSGTSLDGLDLACCELAWVNQKWEYHIVAAETIPYDEKWMVRLTNLHKQPAEIYPKTDLFYGKYIGQCVQQFIAKNKVKPDFIASHGHTIFHQPDKGFTAQIGNGAAIHAETGLPVVYDFRTVDVMLGGQGAPLVPIGDHLLFGEYDACLNLGGIANISFVEKGKRVAFDISPCNILLNRIARNLGKEYDKDGLIARQGNSKEDLLHALNSLSFYPLKGAKSLGIEWIDAHIQPIIMEADLSDQDVMATLVTHITFQIATILNKSKSKKVLITGGGAHNKFLIEKLKQITDTSCIIPETSLVDFKEALVFAFLGVLRIRNEINTLKEVTGAKRDSIGGAIIGC